MPLAWYLAAIDDGRIAPDVLAEELAAVGLPGDPAEELAPHRAAPAARSGRGGTTVARVATELLGRDWVHLEHERISTWAAVHFDRGQAAWRSGATQPSAYASWRDDARIDRTPEVMGAPGFRRAVAELPEDPADVAQRAAMVLHLDEDQLALFTHRLLLQLGGWASHAAWLDFERSLRGEEGDAVVQFAAVLLGWELALFDSLERDGLDLAWAEARRDEAFASGLADVRQPLELVLQRALDRTAQAEVVASLQPSGAAGPPTAAVAPVAPTAPASRATSADRRASVQAIFCIDVRSEVLRRHLEAASDDIETFGFAGFFGAALEYVPVGHDRGRPQCPVLLSPTHTIAEVASAPGGQGEAVRHRRDRHHVQRAPGSQFEDTFEHHHRPTEELDEHGQGNCHTAFAFVAHRAVVDVDPELGLVKVVQIATAQDVGRALNPLSVLGQIEGGIAQGVGLAVMEEIIQTDGKVRNASFTDYLLPTFLDMPDVVATLIEEPDPMAPLGAKGVGEPPCVSSTPAVVAAIRDAIGKDLHRTPVRPSDIVF